MEKRVFVNGVYKSLGQIYIIGLILFILLASFALVDLYIAITDLVISDFNLNNRAIYHLLRVIAIFLILIESRKRFVFKIVTDNKGISFHGLFTKLYARWNEIMSMEPTKVIFFKKRIQQYTVKTKNGNFPLPFSMKEKDREYPKLLTTGKVKYKKWIDENGNEKEVTIENCPLYEEIQKHLGNK